VARDAPVGIIVGLPVKERVHGSQPSDFEIERVVCQRRPSAAGELCSVSRCC
jgi:hypothetical protein